MSYFPNKAIELCHNKYCRPFLHTAYTDNRDRTTMSRAEEEAPEEEAQEQTLIDEERNVNTHVIETPGGPMLATTFNIEWLRFWGLVAIVVLLIIGSIVTNQFVEFPEGSGGFDFKATFIYELFHFNHTCTVLDFNPSRTVSGILMMFHTIPMDLFIALSYFRMKHDYVAGRISKPLWYYTKITTPYIFIAVTYFYMVFVNPPVDMPSFILHYLPYNFWQIAMILMAIGQCGYLAEMEITPFNIPRILLKVYGCLLIATGLYYTIFVWSFIGKTPILDTTITANRNFAVTLMYFFNVLVILIPAIFAFIETRNGNTQTIHFFNTP